MVRAPCMRAYMVAVQRMTEARSLERLRRPAVFEPCSPASLTRALATMHTHPILSLSRNHIKHLDLPHNSLCSSSTSSTVE